MNKHHSNILEIPIDELDLSLAGKSFLKKVGFNTMGDVMVNTWQDLMEIDGFDYIRFNELIRFMDAHDMVHLLEK